MNRDLAKRPSTARGPGAVAIWSGSFDRSSQLHPAEPDFAETVTRTAVDSRAGSALNALRIVCISCDHLQSDWFQSKSEAMLLLATGRDPKNLSVTGRGNGSVSALQIA